MTDDSRDTTPAYGPFHAEPENPLPPPPAWATGNQTGWPQPEAPQNPTVQPGDAAYPGDPFPAPWDRPSSAGPRIEPSPPPDRKRLLLGLVAGLAVGLIIFGAAGFVLGHVTAPTPKPPAPTLSIYEQTQQRLNAPKFDAALTPTAQTWLPYLSACARDSDPGGPALNPGEKAKVRCDVSGMSAIFVEYNTPTDWDKSRTTVQAQNTDAKTLTPGVTAPPKAGNYVEYAYQVTEGKAVRTVSAIRWDDSRSPVAGYLLAYWTDGVGSNWAAMRDLWGRYA